MPYGNVIRVSEYEKLYYDEATSFTEKHWKALCHYLQQANRNTDKPISYFQIINKGIRFTNYVGVVQAGNLTIEILPKTDKATTTAQLENITLEKDQQRWHTALLQMLDECKWLPAHLAGYVLLSLTKQSVLDVYLSVFLAEAERLLHEGLLKKYEPEERNQTTLKGRLLFGKQVSKNSFHGEQFYVCSTAYNANNVYNRILYQAIWLVQQTAVSNSLRHTAGSLLLQFPDTCSIPVSDDIFQQLTYTRKTERYRQAMQFAQMLLLNYSPDITGGHVHTLALLFDMNALWEEWVYRQLKKEEATFGITIQRQQSAAFWEAGHLFRPKTIRPDVVIRQGDKTIILDTKWKPVENGTPADNDLKQMFVYNLYWQCNESILLYPANEVATQVSGQYRSFEGMNREDCSCMILTQTIWDINGKLNASFGKEVLQKILTAQPSI